MRLVIFKKKSIKVQSKFINDKPKKMTEFRFLGLLIYRSELFTQSIYDTK